MPCPAAAADGVTKRQVEGFVTGKVTGFDGDNSRVRVIGAHVQGDQRECHSKHVVFTVWSLQLSREAGPAEGGVSICLYIFAQCTPVQNT